MSQPAEAYRPFVPRRGRAMAWTAAVLSVIVFGIVGFVLVPAGGAAGFTAVDQWSLFALGLVMAWLLSRWALVRATPTAEGLKIRNLFVTRFVPWAQIVNVQFGGGPAWCTLDLDDTDRVAVMAIQRADGPAGVAEAQRLAALVQVNNRVPSDD